MSKGYSSVGERRTRVYEGKELDCSRVDDDRSDPRMTHGYRTCATRVVCGEFTAIPHVW